MRVFREASGVPGHNPASVSPRRDRAGAVPRAARRQVFHLLPGAKERGHVSSDPRPQGCQQVLAGPKVSHGDAKIGHRVRETRRVSRDSGSHGGVSARRNPRGPPTLPSVRSVGAAFSIPSAAIWSGDSPANLYKDHGGGSGSSSQGRVSGASVSGRLADSSEVRASLSVGGTASGRFVAEPWLGDQSGQESAGTVAIPGVFGSVVRHPAGHGISDAGAQSQIAVPSQAVVGQAHAGRLGLPTNGRVHDVHAGIGSLGVRAYAAFAIGLTLPLESGVGAVPSSVAAAAFGSFQHGLVALYRKLDQGHIAECALVDGGHHGCQSVRLGRGVSPEFGAGHLVPDGGDVVHQSVGDQGSEVSPAGVLVVGSRPGGQDSIGQCDHGGVHQPARRHQKSTSGRRGTTVDGMGRTTPAMHSGVAHCGRGKRNLRQVGNTCSGSDGDVQKCQSSAVFCSPPGNGGGRGRCPRVALADRGASLCFPSVAPHRSDAEAHRTSSVARDSGRSRMAAATLVRGSSELGAGASPSVSLCAGPATSGSRLFRPGRMLLSSGMAFERRRLKKRGYTDAVVTTLLRSRKPSTSLAYVRVWTVFETWCLAQDIRPTQASVPEVLHFLQDGLAKGLSASSLRVQVAALALLRGQVHGRTLSAHPDVVRFLRGAKQLRPPFRSPCPSWSLNLVLKALCSVPFEPIRRATVKDLTLKVVFLVAVASARRVSELQALSCREPFLRITDSGVSLRTVPSFLPKVVSAFHLNQTVDLPSFSEADRSLPNYRDLRRLDVRRALLGYLEVTNPFRKSDHLFVLWGGPRRGQAASKTTIARWLKEAIGSAYLLHGKSVPVGLKAHSTRSQAASWAECSQVSAEDICKAATWKSLHTFARHYRLDVHAPGSGGFGAGVLRAGLSGSHPS
ncbi:uncharacterized protein LOC115098760 [Rhinatrema bivittatum]|uniref:uncharacterized protein LOC115098760 n=1 Tax=Rhinatrema bivittatum TaxID=194408 RepID=UPI0011276F41|nr:uncharacterized protein LOC115098760 [Rhinatrema bivittatum]